MLLYKNAPLFSTIPFVLFIEFPSRSVKETSDPSPKGTGKDNSGINTRHRGRRSTKSQKEPSGLPVPCHLGNYSKCFIPLWPNATMFLKQNKNKVTSCSFCSQAVTFHLCLGYNRFKARSHGSSIQVFAFCYFLFRIHIQTQYAYRSLALPARKIDCWL